MLVGFRDDQAEAVSKPYAAGVHITRGVCLPVGWLSVPLGRYGFQSLVSCEVDRKGLLSHFVCRNWFLSLRKLARGALEWQRTRKLWTPTVTVHCNLAGGLEAVLSVNVSILFEFYSNRHTE